MPLTHITYDVPGFGSTEVVFARRAPMAIRPVERGRAGTGPLLAWWRQDGAWKSTGFNNALTMFTIVDPDLQGELLVAPRVEQGATLEDAVVAAYREALVAVDADHGVRIPEPGMIAAITAYAATHLPQEAIDACLGRAIVELLRDRSKKGSHQEVYLPAALGEPWTTSVRFYRPGMDDGIWGWIETVPAGDADNLVWHGSPWETAWHGRPGALLEYPGEALDPLRPLIHQVGVAAEGPGFLAPTHLDRIAAEQAAVHGPEVTALLSEVADAVEEHGDHEMEARALRPF